MLVKKKTPKKGKEPDDDNVKEKEPTEANNSDKADTADENGNSPKRFTGVKRIKKPKVDKFSKPPGEECLGSDLDITEIG